MGRFLLPALITLVGCGSGTGGSVRGFHTNGNSFAGSLPMEIDVRPGWAAEERSGGIRITRNADLWAVVELDQLKPPPGKEDEQAQAEMYAAALRDLLDKERSAHPELCRTFKSSLGTGYFLLMPSSPADISAQSATPVGYIQGKESVALLSLYLRGQVDEKASSDLRAMFASIRASHEIPVDDLHP